jgi:hypothetical protein
MDLLGIFESGIAIASDVFEGNKCDITFKAWIGSDGRGTDEYASPVTLRGIVDATKRQRTTANGNLVMTFASLTFLDAIDDTTANAGEAREQPIDPRDILILPDGGTAPVVQTGGPVNPLTGTGLINETILGTVVRGQ